MFSKDFKSTVIGCPLPPLGPLSPTRGKGVKIATQETHLLLHNVPDTTEPTDGSCLIPRGPCGRSPQGAGLDGAAWKARREAPRSWKALPSKKGQSNPCLHPCPPGAAASH